MPRAKLTDEDRLVRWAVGAPIADVSNAAKTLNNILAARQPKPKRRSSKPKETKSSQSAETHE